MQSEKLEACPFCGGEGVKCLHVDNPQRTRHWVLCRLCHACPGDRPSEQEAVALWNTRAALTPPDHFADADKQIPPVDGGDKLDARLRALDEAVVECKRVASETAFAAEVSADRREGYRQGAEMAAASVRMIAQASLKDVRSDAPPTPTDGSEFVMVPREATSEMWQAAHREFRQSRSLDKALSAALAASPSRPSPSPEQREVVARRLHDRFIERSKARVTYDPNDAGCYANTPWDRLPMSFKRDYYADADAILSALCDLGE